MIGRYRAAYPGRVLRLLLSPRWIMWHLLTLGAMVTCGLLAAWQWGRAESATGSLLNVGYGLQWPLFAVFFGVMWYRMLRLEVRRVAGEQPEEVAAAARRPSPEGPSPFTARPAAGRADHRRDDPELAAYNRMLAMLAQQIKRCKIANARTGPLSDDREAPARLPRRRLGHRHRPGDPGVRGDAAEVLLRPAAARRRRRDGPRLPLHGLHRVHAAAGRALPVEAGRRAADPRRRHDPAGRRSSPSAG